MAVLEKFGASSMKMPEITTEALNKLKDAVSLLESYIDSSYPMYKRLMAITLNNIACYYKQYLHSNNRFNKPNIALQYLSTVLDLEEALGEKDLSIARTHLNICTIESSLGK